MVEVQEEEPEYHNKGVEIIRDEEEEKLKELREHYKKQLGIGQDE